MHLLTDSNFWVIALGTMLLGLAAGVVGSVSVLRGQSLIGDAIGHSSFPGVVLAFMLFLTREPALLMFGALITGVIAYGLIQLYSRHSKTSLDTSLAIVLSSMFGVGMVLKSYIQGNPKFADASQAGLSTYIFGQAAYLSRKDLYYLFIVSAVVLIVFFIFFKEIKLFVFDSEYAQVTGFSTFFLQMLTLVMTMALIVIGLRVVGAILIASMLISPTVAARQWTDRYSVLLFAAGLIGMISAFFGTWISAMVQGVSTGPAIIVCMSVVAIFSLLMGPRGMLRSKKRMADRRQDMALANAASDAQASLDEQINKEGAH